MLYLYCVNKTIGVILKRKTMVKNYFYLIVGMLCLFFAFMHTWNGFETVLPVLNNTEIDNSTRTVFTYIWHIIGVENFIFGVALLIISFHKNPTKVKFTTWIIIAILITRWIVIAYFTLSNNEDFKKLLPDTIAILVVVVLLFFGTKVKRKITNG